MRLMKLCLFLAGSLFTFLQAPTSSHAQDWFGSAAVNGVAGLHSANSAKDSQTSLGLSLDAAYLEQFGFGIDLKYNQADYSVGGGLEQSQVNINAWKLFTPSHFFAQIVLSSDLYFIDNNDTISSTGSPTVLTVSSAFQALSGKFSVTPSYSYSAYKNNFTASQYDMAIHFAFNDLWDHVEYKPSQMMLSDATIAGQDQYLSHQFAYTHYLRNPNGYFGLSNIALHAAFGDRAFYVDAANNVIYNLSDISQSSADLYLNFAPAKGKQWTTGAGYEQFQATSTKSQYVLVYAFLEFKVGW